MTAVTNRILVLYGTTDGQTAKIARAIERTLELAGADVDLVNAAVRGTDPRPDDYAAVIVAASVHAGGYQRAVKRWVTAHAAMLASRQNAFVSVCLGVLEHDPKTDAELTAIAERFFAKTGWRPRVFKAVAGALPWTKYNWIKSWVMRRIVAKKMTNIDTSRDCEYTDWQDLETFTRSFYQRVRPEMPVAV